MTTTDEQSANSTAPEAPPPAAEKPPSPPAPPQEKVELVRKVFVRDLKPPERVLTVFRVTRKQKNVGRSGRAFLAVGLADRTGEIDARVFDQVDKLEAQFSAGDYVLVRGSTTTFHGKPQVVIETVERLDPEPIDPREFTPPPEAKPEELPREAGRAVAQIRELVERVQDTHLKALLISFLDDPELAPGLPIAPAAKGVHHAYRGGLADHLLSVMRLAGRVADHYPMADRDLLIAGALLHDICKVRELSYEKGVDYTDEGRLVGHLVMTAQKIREKASRIDGFPPALEHHLTHLVLSHHGQLEHGSPKEPMTLEALLLHLVDLTDSRVASWLELMAKDPSERWTEATKLYGRPLWKGPAPTARGKSPVEGRRKPKGEREERRRERRQRHAERAAREPERPREERPPAPEPPAAPAAPERDPDLPKELAFKPFGVLTGEPTETK